MGCQAMLAIEARIGVPVTSRQDCQQLLIDYYQSNDERFIKFILRYDTLLRLRRC